MSDVASISNMSSSQLGAEIGMRVAKKQLDAAKQEGQAVMSLLESAMKVQDQMQIQSVQGYHLGQNLDVRA